MKWLLILGTALLVTAAPAQANEAAISGPSQSAPPRASVRPLLLSDIEATGNKEAALLIVQFPPGSVDPIHRHNALVYVYVLEGSIVMQVRGSPEVTLKPGQTFMEKPSDIHVVGRNASKTRPARFLAYFVKDKGALPVLPAE
jgi:quercetin dioxygenase-like cupin family protein